MVREHRCRPLRRRLGVLIDKTGGPDVTARSFDVENRAALGREAPRPARPARRQPDETTRQGRSDRAQSLPEPPADRDPFGWPTLSAPDARRRVSGRRATDEPWLFHLLLSPPLDLKLLHP